MHALHRKNTVALVLSIFGIDVHIGRSKRFAERNFTKFY
jgi:hypothetical protein